INQNGNYIYFSKNEHSAFSSNELKNYLNINRIKTIYLAGFLAEYCVRKTAIDAIKSNYEIFLLKDCIATGDDFQKQSSNLFEEIISLGGKVAESADCL
ncbi:MAG: isochorismatase family protein, partial [Smithella sp.]|nr:isochorismatase family protein [Smithella sp.]